MNDPLDGFLPPLDVPLDPEQERREFLRKIGLGGAVVAGAAVGGPLVGAAAAHAAPGGVGAELTPEAAAALPPIGAEITCSCNAFGATLLVNLPPPLPTLNFTGSITVRVEVGGATFVRLRVLNHTVTAAHPMFGAVTIKLPDIDASPASLLNFGPGGFLQTMFLSFKITFDKCGDCPGPFELQTLKPAELVGSMLKFPPAPVSGEGANATGGIMYGLNGPIALGLPGGAKNTTPFAGFKKFDVRVGHVG